MAWNLAVENLDPHQSCLICGSDQLQVSAAKVDENSALLGDHFLQACGLCGSVTLFYHDTLHRKYYYIENPPAEILTRN